ncbi:rod shape-determining protein MreD [Candidatus Parabeggiatoa sp. HSG14]|uniref:rod shape-determining protein MreD n=1 Tax=Candidatus Parabeggiatoa sp. HSG14 TaxID=3055593 RepID=UPI0025A8B666|nr:rod shape-determining protein MreD [Thiotrichales bacterium HSG14]
MSLEPHHGGWVIVLSFLVSFMLAIMPLPAWATVWRPDWIALVLTYWCIAVPQRVGVASGWFVGLIHDVLSDTLLGQHALTLCIIAFISVKLHRRIRLFPRWQQVMGVFGLITASQLLNAGISSIVGNPLLEWSFIYPAITSCGLWPWVFIILRDMRRTYQVY